MSPQEKAFFSFCRKYKRLPTFSEMHNDHAVGRWRWRINSLYKLGKISHSLRKDLDSLPYWEFIKDGWYSEYENLEYSFVHQINVSTEQKLWLEKQSELFKEFKLPDEKSNLLDALPISWLNLPGNQKKLIYNWFERFELLKIFHCKFKKLPSNNHRGKEDFDFDLYDWLNRQRKYYRNGKLKVKQNELLNGIEKDWHLNEVEKSFYAKISYLKKYYDKHRSYPDSNGWLVENRMHYRQGKLPNWKIVELEKLPEWEWTAREAKFLKTYKTVEEFLIKNKRPPRMGDLHKGVNIYEWIISAKSRYKEKGLFPNKKKAEMLERLPFFTWDSIEDEWNKNFELLKEYVTKKAKYPCPKEKYKSANIGSWLGTQRSRYKRSTISEAEIMGLESLAGWSWSPFDDVWEQRFKEYQQNIDGELNEELIRWTSKQRAKYVKGKLEKYRIAKLESLANWYWYPQELKWQKKCEELKRYIDEHRSFPEPQSILGSWIYRQQADYRGKRISRERIKALELISIWVWKIH